VAADPPLTPYERRCWKRLQRELEAADPEPGRPTRFRTGPRYPARWLSGAAALLAVLGAAVLGGAVAVVAVCAYFGLGLALWGLHRAVWRTSRETLKDLI
jgi:Protein of unknown function (DUF3040)